MIHKQASTPGRRDHDIEVLVGDGIGRYVQGELAEAQRIFDRVLTLEEENEVALYYSGLIDGRLGVRDRARIRLAKVIARRPQHIDALNALANVEASQERYQEAGDLYRRALLLHPNSVPLLSNYGLCMRLAGKLDEATAVLEQSHRLDATAPDPLLGLALVAIDQGAVGEARLMLQRCLQLDESLAEAHTAHAHLLLQNGEFEAGWREYEWRFRCRDAHPYAKWDIPAWDGDFIPEEVLLVRAEQGLGDQIMFASCFSEAIERTQLCLVECDPRLIGIFASSFPKARFFPHSTKLLPKWKHEGIEPDRQVFMGSLPKLFRTCAADFPNHPGYMRADPERVEYWHRRLSGLGSGARVGIAWRGGAPATRREMRSIPLSDWFPILRQSDKVFVSLQYGDVTHEVESANASFGVRVHHWPEVIRSYDDTAALIESLDCVVSVQTSVAHLAGALGRQALILVSAVPEWRYLARGESMPWYPSIRLIRQARRGVWLDETDRVAQLLENGAWRR